MKDCGKCRASLVLSAFWKCSSTPDGLQKQCKGCQRKAQKDRSQTLTSKQAQKRWNENNPEKMKMYRNKWARENLETILQWRRDNPDKWRAIKQRQRDKLADGYVKGTIARGEFSHLLIPDSLVEAKRQHLLIKRRLQELLK